MYTGPKIVKDSSLIFYYDTGNSKSYVGEPTTNLVTNPINFNGGWTSYSNGNDGMFLTDLGTMGYRMDNQPAWNGIYMNFNLVNSGTYTFSAKIKYWNSAGGCNSGTVYVSNYGAGDVGTVADTSIIGKWQTVKTTVNVTSPTNVVFYLISYGGSTGNVSSWEVTQPQIELNSRATSFTQGTRSVTQGLVPLSGTVSLDLTNMAFNSNSQLTFNGTNNYIISPHNVNFNILPITIESYVYRTFRTSNDGLDIFNKYYSSSVNGYRVGINSSGSISIYYFKDGSNYIDYAAAIGSTSTNTWYHIVVTFGVTGAVVYINGVVAGTKSWVGTPGSTTTTQQIEIGRYPPSGGNFNGEIPFVKVYNKLLSASEVFQNFTATRNRFNI